MVDREGDSQLVYLSCNANNITCILLRHQAEQRKVASDVDLPKQLPTSI